MKQYLLTLLITSLSYTYMMARLSKHTVYNLTSSGDNIYSATAEGLGCYNTTTGTYTLQALPATLQQERPWCVAARDGQLYVGTYDGRIGTMTPEGFTARYKVPGNDGYRLMFSVDGTLYTVNHLLTDLAAGKGYIVERASISSNFFLNDAYPTPDGKIWLCGSDMFGGLYRFEGDTIVSVAENALGDLLHIDGDSKGSLWVTTVAGELCQMNGNTVAARYGSAAFGQEGLKPRQVAVDDDDNVWVCGTALARFDGQAFTRYALPETGTVYCMKWMNGKLLIGATNGLYVFNDDKVTLLEASVTRIGGTETGTDAASSPRHNLQGMRVDRPQPGTVYIQDGKKHVMRR